MQIDAHQHFWQYDAVRHSWIGNDMSVLKNDFFPSDLKPLLDKQSVDGCVAVQADQSKNETDFLVGLAEQNDFIRGVVGWIDLRSPSLSEQLQEYTSVGKLKGFRHVLQAEPAGFMLQEDFIEGVRTLGKYGFTYDLLVTHNQLEEALQFLDHVRETRIVIDHLAKPSIKTREKTEWELHMAAIGTFNNVHCKISGMVTEADWKNWHEEDFHPYLDEVMEIFGPRRLMYGSDWPVCLLAASYDQQYSIVTNYLEQLSPTEKNFVMGENARIFYDL